ncbi:MAG: hypothetical protein AB2598_00285 [Candidatus Thiodiazotropha sp.]
MGDTTLGAGSYRFNLGNHRLRLDPNIEAHMSQLRAGVLPPRLQHLFLRPNWITFDCNALNLMLLQLPGSATPSRSPAAGPATPRPGQVGDVMRAVWSLPAVQQSVNRLLRESERRLRREWNQGGTAHRAMMVSAATTVVGTSLTALLVNPSTRDMVLNFIDGRQLPVPGLRGLSVQLRGRGRGGGMRLRNIGGTGLAVNGGASRSSTSGRVDWDIGITLDLTQMVPALR